MDKSQPNANQTPSIRLKIQEFVKKPKGELLGWLALIVSVIRLLVDILKR